MPVDVRAAPVSHSPSETASSSLRKPRSLRRTSGSGTRGIVARTRARETTSAPEGERADISARKRHVSCGVQRHCLRLQRTRKLAMYDAAAMRSIAGCDVSAMRSLWQQQNGQGETVCHGIEHPVSNAPSSDRKRPRSAAWHRAHTRRTEDTACNKTCQSQNFARRPKRMAPSTPLAPWHRTCVNFDL